ncbi:MAG: sigma 54-interacting transcriptional regulator [Planctomycetaceae bacterium]
MSKDSANIAYLVIREGKTWRDVYRLSPGQVATLGRAPTNRIVVRDEICSRNHCEVFHSDGHWTLRDLGSRNGTLLDGVRISGEVELNDNQIIQIGSCGLGFTYDLSNPFPAFEEDLAPFNEADTALEFDLVDPESPPEPEILHRKRKTRYYSTAVHDTDYRDQASQVLAKLYRLALEMGAARDAKTLTEIVMDGLLSGTKADIGAILRLPNECKESPQPRDLRLMVYKATTELPYQKVSDSLSHAVLGEREAVLARDIADDSRLVTRDSLGKIHVKSVICAPIRLGNKLCGLIHLYSTNPDISLDEDDLEFTLAVADQLGIAWENLKEKETLADGLARIRDENETLRKQLAQETELVGDSPEMLQLKQDITRIAPSDAIVLIRGESGVGKELVARAIHFASHRHKALIVCMNCAALSESLLESELFGHEKGSFTGATGRKIGKFEQANQGTLFLDEVGEMSLTIQAKFLRVLEGHPFERVGGSTPIKVDVRVVAATNRDLELAVEEGKFRKDLYFRLHVVEVPVPPLREHKSDIPRLVRYFVERFIKKSGQVIRGISDKAMEMLVAYDWPGNIRELQNAVERAVVLASSEIIQVTDIRLSTLGSSESDGPAAVPSAAGYREVPLEVIEQEHILTTLELTNGNKSRAAQILGIERSTLDRKLKRYEQHQPPS